jgi:hypothetical protein
MSKMLVSLRQRSCGSSSTCSLRRRMYSHFLFGRRSRVSSILFSHMRLSSIGSVDKMAWNDGQLAFSRGQSARFVVLLKERSLGSREPLRLVCRACEFYGAALSQVQKLTREVLEFHIQHQHKLEERQHVLSRGKSQGISDSNGDCPT